MVLLLPIPLLAVLSLTRKASASSRALPLGLIELQMCAAVQRSSFPSQTTFFPSAERRCPGCKKQLQVSCFLPGPQHPQLRAAPTMGHPSPTSRFCAQLRALLLLQSNLVCMPSSLQIFDISHPWNKSKRKLSCITSLQRIQLFICKAGCSKSVVSTVQKQLCYLQSVSKLCCSAQ